MRIRLTIVAEVCREETSELHVRHQFETRLARVRHRFATTLESTIKDTVASADRMSRGGDGAVKHGRFGTFADAIGVDLIVLIREP